MPEAPIHLLKLLDIEPIEVNLFRGISPRSKWPRVYGGQVIGQAMVAACRTVEGRLPHSLHAYFILAGDPSVPIIYEVGRLRDGRSFSTRRVTAIQHGNAIFSMIVSFAAQERDSFNHQEVMPEVPPPEAFSPEKMAGHPLLANAPKFVKRFFESDSPAGAVRSKCGPWNSSATSARRRRAGGSISGSRPMRSCRTIRRSTSARWPMPRTWRCWTRSPPGTGRRCFRTT